MLEGKKVCYYIDIVGINNKRQQLVASCGMDCGLCSGYLAYSHDLPKKTGKIIHCIGCRARNKKCAFLKRDCAILSENRVDFCYECETFPCDRLKRLSERYRTKYSMSFIENLNLIKEKGLEEFIRDQSRKYKCPQCGDLICIHNGKCYSCDEITSWKG